MPSRWSAMLYVAMAAILWSTAGLAIKSVPWHPIAIAGIRSTIACVVLLVYWRFAYKRFPPLPTAQKAFGAFNYVALVYLFIGANKLTTAANAILLQFTSPVWVLILAAVCLKERVRLRDVVTVLFVLVGMSLFFVGDISGGGLLGNFFAILSGVAMAVMVVSLKGVKTGSPLEIIFWGNVFAAIASLPFWAGIVWSTESLMGIGFLGIFQLGLSYIFYAKGVQGVSALEGILISALEPLLNPVWVFLFNGEKPSGFALLGGAVVLIAVVWRSLKTEQKVVETCET